GDFQWQKSREQYSELEVELSDGRTETYNLGNSVQNGSTHQINSSMDMRTIYRYIGLTKITPAAKRAREQKRGRAAERSGSDLIKSGDLNTGTEPQGRANLTAAANPRTGAGREGGGGASLHGGDKSINVLIDLITSLKRIQFNYQENNGIFLPGYTPSVGFMGTLRPTAGFVFGSQAEVRELAARN